MEYMAKDLAWDAVQSGPSGTAPLGELEALGLETLRAPWPRYPTLNRPER